MVAGTGTQTGLVPTTISKTVVHIGTVTGSSISEVTAALNAASQSDSSSGLSSSNKKIIIGVIAGVGGFIIVACLGLLGFRMIAKKPKEDDYMQAKTIEDTDVDAMDRYRAQRPAPLVKEPIQINTASNF